VNAAIKFVKSSIGKKWIVAATGLGMFLFVIGHLAGNLQFFIGPDAINQYGAMLHAWPELLWVIRLGLITCLGLHVLFSFWVLAENRKARPLGYAVNPRVTKTLSTRFMALTGLLLLAFIIFHILHFTSHSVKPEFSAMQDEKGRHDVYRMMVVGFSDPLVVTFYIVAMTMLCFHLTHGAWSWMQTLGLRTKKLSASSMSGAHCAAAILAIGFASLPASVLLGGIGKGYVAERQNADQATKIDAAAEASEGAQIKPASGSN
jgi:succinate dehydrogenase / fumarate reductase cytochrome b subunit